MVKRLCCICSQYADGKEMIRLSMRTSRTTILLSSLVLFAGTDIGHVRNMYAQNQTRIFVCEQHLATVGQYIGAEIHCAGRSFSETMDEQAGVVVTRVVEADIPEHLLSGITKIVTDVTGGTVTVTKKNLVDFENACLHQWYSGGHWSGRSPIGEDEMDESANEEAQDALVNAEEPMAVDGAEDDDETPPSSFAQPLLSRQESGSSGMTLSSPYTPTPKKRSSGSSVDSFWDITPLPETDPKLLDQFFLIQGALLLSLFRFCPECGQKLPSSGGVRLTAQGTAPVIHYICRSCSLRKNPIKRFEGQPRTVDHPREKSFLGNVLAVASAVVTGTRYVELERWAKHMRLCLFSDSFFWKWFKHCKPAIEQVYERCQRNVFALVRRNAQEDGLHLAADGSYDSRGYSALIGKVVLVDLNTKLVLHTEVLHRSETGGISSRMEIEGMRRLLLWLKAEGWVVSSLTTDRNRSVPVLLKELEKDIGVVTHYFDGWHMVKWLGNKLLKESKGRDCAPIAAWRERVKTHLWRAIQDGTGEQIRHLFNTCLMHVRGIHSWAQEETTGPYTACEHAELDDGPHPEAMADGSPAFTRFRNCVLNKTFQKDLVKACDRGGTSICETKNSIDRLYSRKDIYYPLETYQLYSRLSTMHYNALRIAEITGERTEGRVLEIQRKYLHRKSVVVYKTPIEHTWREQIIQNILLTRLVSWDNPAFDDEDEATSTQILETAEAELIHEAEISSHPAYDFLEDSELDLISDEEDI